MPCICSLHASPPTSPPTNTTHEYINRIYTYNTRCMGFPIFPSCDAFEYLLICCVVDTEQIQISSDVEPKLWLGPVRRADVLAAIQKALQPTSGAQQSHFVRRSLYQEPGTEPVQKQDWTKQVKDTCRVPRSTSTRWCCILLCQITSPSTCAWVRQRTGLDVLCPCAYSLQYAICFTHRHTQLSAFHATGASRLTVLYILSFLWTGVDSYQSELRVVNSLGGGLYGRHAQSAPGVVCLMYI